jgi:hypothetical protein
VGIPVTTFVHSGHVLGTHDAHPIIPGC